MTEKYDVIIIGAGISGCAVAWKLARYNLDILLLEKEADVAVGTTKANTAIIHAGYNADPNKLKGRLNVKGNEEITDLAKKLNIPYSQIGSLVVALEGDDLSVIDKLYQKGLQNDVKNMKIVDRDWLFEQEPNISRKAVKALWAPTAGIITPWEAALAMAQNAVANGAEIKLETKVEDIIIKNEKVSGVKTSQGNFAADYIVNAAGLYADKISEMVGIENIKITPRKGEYYIYDHAKEFSVNHTVFPIPTENSKGIIVTPTVENNILIGPNSHNVDSKTDLATTKSGLKEVFNGAQKLYPNLDLKNIIRSFAGLRAVDASGDFVIKAADNIKGFINVAGIQSPGLASCTAIADYTAEILAAEGLKLSEKINYIETREEPVRFYEMTNKERAKKVDSNKDYGQIICRCETVSYQEIIDAINSPIGARTVNAVKRRTRAGGGRCQGGFCGPRVVDILAKELGISPTEVKQEEDNSQILDYKIKELLESR